MFDKKLIIYPGVEFNRAIHLAKRFLRDYPDKVGFRNGAVYSLTESFTTSILYVYQTRTAIIVRGDL